MSRAGGELDGVAEHEVSCARAWAELEMSHERNSRAEVTALDGVGRA